jgi:hypothetical protein
VIYEAFSIEQDDDIVMHQPPSPEDLRLSRFDSEDLRIDMRGEIGSRWNIELLEILEERLSDLGIERDLPARSSAYLMELLRNRLIRLRNNWRSAQPKKDEFGNLETPEAVERRVLQQTLKAKKEARMRERRIRVRFCLFFMILLFKRDVEI